MPGGDAAYSGFVTDGLLPLAAKPLWQVSAAGGRTFGLIAGNGLVLFSTDGTVVHALNWATGEAVWSANLDGELVGEFILVTLGNGQTIVVAPTEEGLQALSLLNGQAVWPSPSNDLLKSKVGGVTIGSDGNLYTVTRHGWLYGLRPSDGALIWSTQLTTSEEFSLPPVLAETTLLITSRTKVVRAFNLTTLATLWARTLPENILVPPCAAAGMGHAYLGSEKGTVYALRLDNGDLAWSKQTPRQVAGLAHDAQRLYATLTNGQVLAWNGADGALTWTTSTDGAISSAPLTDGNWVLVTTQGGQVRFLAAATGQEAEARRLTFADAFYRGAAPVGGWLFVRGTNLYGVNP